MTKGYCVENLQARPQEIKSALCRKFKVTTRSTSTTDKPFYFGIGHGISSGGIINE